VTQPSNSAVANTSEQHEVIDNKKAAQLSGFFVVDN
jgi:hypothetical protein